MLTNDLFNTDYERRLAEGAVDRLEQRRIDDLNMKMDDLAKRVKSTANPEHKKALLKAFLDCKEERDSYYKVREELGSGGQFSTLEGAEDFANTYSPEAIALGKKFCEQYNITNRDDVQMAVEIIDLELQALKNEGRPVDLKQIRKSVADAFRYVHRGMGSHGFNFRKKFQGEGTNEAGIPGNLPPEQVPGKEDLLRGRGRQTYEEAELDESFGPIGSKALMNGNFASFLKARAARMPIDLEFGAESVRLTPAIMDAIAKKYAADKSASDADPKNRDKKLVAINNYRSFGYPDMMKKLIDSVASPEPDVPAGAPGEQLPMFERAKPVQKKNSKNADELTSTSAEDPQVRRELQKVRARHPAARSDIEALVKDEIVNQERIDREMDRQKATDQEQNAQIAQLSQINKQQDARLASLDKGVPTKTKAEPIQPTADKAAPGKEAPKPTPAGITPIYIAEPEKLPAKDQEIYNHVKQLEKQLGDKIDAMATWNRAAANDPGADVEYNALKNDIEQNKDKIERLTRSLERYISQAPALPNASDVVDIDAWEIPDVDSAQELEPVAAANTQQPTTKAAESVEKPSAIGQMAKNIGQGNELQKDPNYRSQVRRTQQQVTQRQKNINQQQAGYGDDPDDFGDIPDINESHMSELDIARQDLELMTDRQFMAAYGMSKQAFQQKYRSQLRPAAQQDIPVKEGWSDAIVARRTGQPRTPYSIYIKGRKWKDFENEDHAEAVANKLRAKFKAEGRDPSVITIAPTDYDKPIKEDSTMTQQDWMKSIKQQYPNVSFAQNKKTMQILAMVPGKGKVATYNQQQVNEFEVADLVRPNQQAQTSTPPRRAYSIALQGKPGRDYAAEQVWKALPAVFPNEYPPTNAHRNSPVHEKVQEVSRRGTAIVKSGINSEDIAESYVAKLARFVPAQYWRIIGGELEEAQQWQGNLGAQQAQTTDHTMDEAIAYIKKNYPAFKKFRITRAEPGFRADLDPGQYNRSNAQVNDVDSAMDYLQLRENPVMSGSRQPTPSLGYSWHTNENPSTGMAVFYYEDRGMGWDEVIIAGKTKEKLAQAVQVFRDAGVIPSPKVKEAANPAQQAAIAIAMKKAGKKPKHVDEAQDQVDPIILKALERLQPGLKGSQLYSAAKEALALEVGLMKSRGDSTFVHYLNQLQDLYTQRSIAEAQTDFQKRRQRERDVDAGKPVARQRPSKQTDYQKRRAEQKRQDELGEEKTRLDPRCWKGKKIGNPKTKMKGGVRVNNCVPAESVEEEAKKGLYYYVNKRKKAGTSRDKDDPRAPSAQDWKNAAKTAKKESVEEEWSEKYKRSIDCSHPKGFSQKAHCAGRKKNESYADVVESQGITDSKLLEAARKIDLLSKSFK